MLQNKNSALSAIAYRQGELYFAESNINMLAKNYKTPLYIMSEDIIRERCRIFKECAARYFGDESRICYASKAVHLKQFTK